MEDAITLATEYLRSIGKLQPMTQPTTQPTPQKRLHEVRNRHENSAALNETEYQSIHDYGTILLTTISGTAETLRVKPNASLEHELHAAFHLASPSSMLLAFTRVMSDMHRRAQ